MKPAVTVLATVYIMCAIGMMGWWILQDIKRNQQFTELRTRFDFDMWEDEL